MTMLRTIVRDMCLAATRGVARGKRLVGWTNYIDILRQVSVAGIVSKCSHRPLSDRIHHVPLVAAAWSLTAARSRLKALSAAPDNPCSPTPEVHLFAPSCAWGLNWRMGAVRRVRRPSIAMIRCDVLFVYVSVRQCVQISSDAKMRRPKLWRHELKSELMPRESRWRNVPAVSTTQIQLLFHKFEDNFHHGTFPAPETRSAFSMGTRYDKVTRSGLIFD